MSESRSSTRRGASGRRPRRDDLALPAAGPTSWVRTGLAALLVVVGIAYVVLYVVVGDPANGKDSLSWMGDITRWNYLIGFGLIFLGLVVAAHPSTPLGRGRGVVVGMLGCFLIGLLWIVTYYVLGQNADVPLLTDLAQYNLVVGIGFMAVGFVYATRWE